MNLWDWFSDDINWGSGSDNTTYTNDGYEDEYYTGTPWSGWSGDINWDNTNVVVPDSFYTNIGYSPDQGSPIGTASQIYEKSFKEDERSLFQQARDWMFGEEGLDLEDDTIKRIAGFAKAAQGFTKERSKGGQKQAPRRSRSSSLSGPVGRGSSEGFKATQTSSQLIANMIAQSQRGANAANSLSDRAYREAAKELNMAIIQAISGEGKPEGPNITGKAPTISITSRVT